MYPADIQVECLNVRRTGLGFDGRPVLFRSRRLPTTAARADPPSRARRTTRAQTALIDKLSYLLPPQMAESDIRLAVAAAFPAGC